MGKALVVDDEAEIREVIDSFVRHTRKFESVDKVSSGEDAMKIFEPGKYDLVVLDIGLPDLLGTEVSYLMKLMDEKVIIVGVTGCLQKLGTGTTANEILNEAGFDKIFIKPFEYKDFFDFVSNLE